MFSTAGSNPAPHLPMFHDNGIKVLHKCTSVRHAVKAQSLGVDGISIDGFDLYKQSLHDYQHQVKKFHKQVKKFQHKIEKVVSHWPTGVKPHGGMGW